jgi:hypothetical protein
VLQEIEAPKCGKICRVFVGLSSGNVMAYCSLAASALPNEACKKLDHEKRTLVHSHRRRYQRKLVLKFQQKPP